MIRAPLGRRLLAAGVDLAFVAAIVAISLLREQATPTEGLFTCLGFSVAGISWLVRDTGGASPGKRLAGLMVQRADGARVGTATSAQRNAVLGVGVVLSGAGTVLIADPLAEWLATLAAALGGLLLVGAVLDATLVLFETRGGRLSDRWARTHVFRAEAG